LAPTILGNPGPVEKE